MPIFLEVHEYDAIVRFIQRPPCDPVSELPELLMPVGAVASGKSTLCHGIMGGLVMALRDEDARNGGKGISRRPLPLFFKFAFEKRCEAGAAARALLRELLAFATRNGVAVDPADEAIASQSSSAAAKGFAASALDVLPGVAGRLAEDFSRIGRELWLLIDEAQGPVLGSTAETADTFAEKLKAVRARVCC